MTINHQIWSCPIFQTRFWLVSDSHSEFLVGFFSDQISALAGEQVLQPGRAMLLVATTWPGHESDVVQPDATNAIWLPADLVWREMIRYLEEFYTACADARRELWVQTFGDSVAKGNVISPVFPRLNY